MATYRISRSYRNSTGRAINSDISGTGPCEFRLEISRSETHWPRSGNSVPPWLTWLGTMWAERNVIIGLIAVIVVLVLAMVAESLLYWRCRRIALGETDYSKHYDRVVLGVRDGGFWCQPALCPTTLMTPSISCSTTWPHLATSGSRRAKTKPTRRRSYVGSLKSNLNGRCAVLLLGWPGSPVRPADRSR